MQHEGKQNTMVLEVDIREKPSEPSSEEPLSNEVIRTQIATIPKFPIPTLQFMIKTPKTYSVEQIDEVLDIWANICIAV
ncbi:hypothetical protein KSS87_013494 [Heliosperma pusillum]|nr:hypothetical protein KSS87_013494 [Heliosperma pusillum]